MTEPSLGERDRLAALPHDHNEPKYCGACRAAHDGKVCNEHCWFCYNEGKRAGVTLRQPGAPTPIGLCGGELSATPSSTGLFGCGHLIWPEQKGYRCTGCDVLYHHECALKHFGSHDALAASLGQISSGEPGAPITTEGLHEAALKEAVAVELETPLCVTCESADIYERSPESCSACAELRVTAAIRAYLASAPLPDTEGANARTLRSLAAMLGWGNVPPQHVFEAEIRALKARATAPLGERNTPQTEGDPHEERCDG